MSLPVWLQVRPDGVVISLKVQPRAQRKEVGGSIGSELKAQGDGAARRFGGQRGAGTLPG